MITLGIGLITSLAYRAAGHSPGKAGNVDVNGKSVAAIPGLEWSPRDLPDYAGNWSTSS